MNKETQLFRQEGDRNEFKQETTRLCKEMGVSKVPVNWKNQLREKDLPIEQRVCFIAHGLLESTPEEVAEWTSFKCAGEHRSIMHQLYGRILFWWNETSAAKKEFEKGAKAAKTDLHRMRCYVQLLKVLHTQEKLPAREIRNISWDVDLLFDDGATVEKGVFHYIMGFTAIRESQFRRAVKHLKQSIGYLTKGKSSYYLIRANHTWGDCYREVSEWKKALKFYQEAESIAKQAGLEYELSMNRLNVAFIQSALGQKDDALKSMEKSAAMFESNSLFEEAARAYEMMGNVQLSLNEENPALDLYTKAATNYRTVGLASEAKAVDAKANRIKTTPDIGKRVMSAFYGEKSWSRSAKASLREIFLFVHETAGGDRELVMQALGNPSRQHYWQLCRKYKVNTKQYFPRKRRRTI